MSFLSAENYIDEYVQTCTSAHYTGASLDGDKYDKLTEHAHLVDELYAELGGDTISLDCQDDSGDLVIELVFPDMILRNGRENPFFEFLETVDKVCFCQNADGNIGVSLTVNKLWRVIGEQKKT